MPPAGRTPPCVGHADHRRAHRVLADAVVHLPAAGVLERLRLLVGELGAGVAGEVGGAGEQAGHAVERGVERLLDRDTRGDLLALLERRQRRLPAGDAGGAPTGIPRGLVERRRGLALRPLLELGCAAFGGVVAVRRDEIGGRPERLVGDAHHRFGAGDLLGGERVAVGLVVVGPVGARRGDVAAQDQQRRLVGDGLGGRRAPPRAPSQSSAISPRCTTFQPYASKRMPTSSLYASDVLPSIVMWLSS